MSDGSKDAERRESAYQLVGELVDGIVAQVCARHYFAPTQEHQFTSKIADRLEERLNNIEVSGMRVTVHAQDFPDKGRGSMEAKSGGDVYISVVVDAPGLHVNKGMMVQSKWDDTVSESRKGLEDQTRKMKARTKSSYVWVYGPASIGVVPSSDVHDGRLDFSDVKTVGGLISDSLRCQEGDPNIGLDLTLPIPQSLTAIMERLSADHAVSLRLIEE